MRMTSRIGCWAWVVLLVGGVSGAQHAVAPDVTEPNPKLTPEQVISIQLQALKNNDTPSKDYGIQITFNFASPGNKASTGPLSRFILMVKNPLYLPMLQYRSEIREPIQVEGRVARQKVTLVGADGKRAVFVFVLSKQKEGPYKNCWMTDAVVRVNDETAPTRVAEMVGAVLGFRDSPLWQQRFRPQV